MIKYIKFKNPVSSIPDTIITLKCSFLCNYNSPIVTIYRSHLITDKRIIEAAIDALRKDESYISFSKNYNYTCSKKSQINAWKAQNVRHRFRKNSIETRSVDLKNKFSKKEQLKNNFLCLFYGLIRL